MRAWKKHNAAIAHQYSTLLVSWGRRPYSTASASSQCPFNELGVDREASKETVTKAYRALAKKHHPDVGGCNTKFKKINEAYEECKVSISNRKSGATTSSRHSSTTTTRTSQREETHYQHSETHTTSRSHQGSSGHFYGNAGHRTGSHQGSHPGSDGHRQYYQQQSESEKEFEEFVRREMKAQRRMAREEFERMFGKQQFNAAGYYDFDEQPTPEQQRAQAFKEKIKQTSDTEELDQLLDACLDSRSKDPGQFLLDVLRRYHFGMPLGEEHLAKCFQAIDRWEDKVDLKASNVFYHEILQIYTDYELITKYGQQVVTPAIETILDKMESKGVDRNDWTLTLANKAFRFHPIPQW